MLVRSECMVKDGYKKVLREESPSELPFEEQNFEIKLLVLCVKQRVFGSFGKWLFVSGRSSSSSSGEDHNERYIQTSKIPTMHFQAGLFRLGIPKLEDTCARYLSALEPVVQNETSYAETKQLTQEFLQGIGKGDQSESFVLD